MLLRRATSPPQFCMDWFTPHIELFTRHLAPLRGQPHVNMLEIGSFEGRSACWLLSNILTHSSARLTCVDPFPLTKIIPSDGSTPFLLDPWKHFRANIRAVKGGARVIVKRGTSNRVLRTLPFASFDAFYIDGSHETRDVLRDAILAWDLLKDGGLFLFDDYGYAPEDRPTERPRIALDAFLSIFGEDCELLERGWMLIGRKHVHEQPPSGGVIHVPIPVHTLDRRPSDPLTRTGRFSAYPP